MGRLYTIAGPSPSDVSDCGCAIVLTRMGSIDAMGGFQYDTETKYRGTSQYNSAFQGTSRFHTLLREMPYCQYIELNEKASGPQILGTKYPCCY